MISDHDIARRVQEVLSVSAASSPPPPTSSLPPSQHALSVAHRRELQTLADALLRHDYELSALELEREVRERFGAAHGVQSLFAVLRSPVPAPAPAAPALLAHPALAHLDLGPGGVEAAWAPLAQRDHRIALLEYELEEAKEQLGQLRRLVGVAQGHEGAWTEDVAATELTELEQRMLNSLVKEYLRSGGHKRAAVALDDSCSEFEDVAAAGQDLAQVYRAARAPRGELERLQETLEETRSEAEDARSRAERLQEELAAAETRAERAESRAIAPELHAALARYERSQLEAEPTPAPGEETSEADEASQGAPTNAPTVAREVPQDAGAARGYVQGLSAAMLPELLREGGTRPLHARDLFPWAFAALADHADPAVRAALLQATLAALPAPDAADRQAFGDEVGQLATRVDPHRLETEVLLGLLPHVTTGADALQHCLVESLRGIVPHLSAACCDELLLPVLRQCLRDAQPPVQQAAVATLAELLPRLPVRRCLPQAQSALWEALEASTDGVGLEAVHGLLPRMLQWCRAEDTEEDIAEGRGLLELADAVLGRCLNAAESFEGTVRHVEEVEHEGGVVGESDLETLRRNFHTRNYYLGGVAQVLGAVAEAAGPPVAPCLRGVAPATRPRSAGLRWLCRKALPCLVALACRVAQDTTWRAGLGSAGRAIGDAALPLESAHASSTSDGALRRGGGALNLAPGLAALCDATRRVARRLGLAFMSGVLVPVLLRAAAATLPGACLGDEDFARLWSAVLATSLDGTEGTFDGGNREDASPGAAWSDRSFAALTAILGLGRRGGDGQEGEAYDAFLEAMLGDARVTAAMMRPEAELSARAGDGASASAVLALLFRGALPSSSEGEALATHLLKATTRALVWPPGEEEDGCVVAPAVEAAVAESLAGAVAAALEEGVSSWVGASLLALWQLVAEETEAEARLEAQHAQAWREALEAHLDEDDGSEEDGSEEDEEDASPGDRRPRLTTEEAYGVYDDLEGAEEDEDRAAAAATGDGEEWVGLPMRPTAVLIPLRRSEAHWHPDGPLGFLARVFAALVPLMPSTLVAKRLLPALFMLTEPRPRRGARSGRFGWQLLLQRCTTCSLGLAGALSHAATLPQAALEEVESRLELMLSLPDASGVSRGGWPLPAMCYILVRVLGKLGFVGALHGSGFAERLLGTVAASMLSLTTAGDEKFERHAATLLRIAVALRRCAERLGVSGTDALDELERRLDKLDEESNAGSIGGASPRSPRRRASAAAAASSMPPSTPDERRPTLTGALAGFRSTLGINLFPTSSKEG